MFKTTIEALARRSFLSRLGMAVPLMGVQAPPAPSTPAGPWQPAHHALDDWFDKIPGRHRGFFDTINNDALGRAILFCNNYMEASKTGYGLEPADLALIVGVRYQSAAFAFTDAMWAKYSGPLSNWAFRDPRPAQPSTKNARQAQLNDLAKRGVQISVCDMATHNISRSIARSIDGNADDIYKELIANRVDNAHQVPAGIVAVNRAQERGYSTM